MNTPTVPDERLKQAMKAALAEILEERSDLIHDILVEALEDVALSRAIEEGEATDLVSRDEIFELLEGKP